MIKNYFFNNNSITLDFIDKTVNSLKFKGEEMIEGNVSFFSLRMRKRDDTHYFLPAKEFKFEKYEDGKAYYSHKEADVILTIKELLNGLKWSIKVINHTDSLLEQVEIMTLGLHPQLIDEGGKGEIDIPYNEGLRVTSMKRREESVFRYFDVDYPSEGLYYMCPNMISSPFMAYINDGTGLYLAMLDKESTPKHIDFRYFEGVLKTEFAVFTNIDYGQSYEMDFDSVMLFFEGDYFDACDLYREWFYQNNGKKYKTIKDQYDKLPHWYHESPVVVTYPVVGTKDSDKEMKPGGLYPYTNGLAVMDYYGQQTDSKIMALLMHWESTAPWAPPYVWPPYGDVDNFYKYRDELHKRGYLLGVYTSGFGWTNVSHRREYDKTEEFKKDHLADIMCVNTKGEMRSVIVQDIRQSYDMCPACEKTKDLIRNETKKMIDGGIDYIQILDQNHGGNPYFCYSDKHGHVPAPGKWQVKETLKLLESIDKKQVILGCESAASEPYLGQLLLSDNRFIIDFHPGEPIPMYSYIYHEYVNNFMGNQISCGLLSGERYGYTYRMAYSFIAGDLYTYIIDGDGKTHIAWCNDEIISDEMPNRLIKNTNKWRLGYFERFLHYGKMVKPLPYECGTKHMTFVWTPYREFNFRAVLSLAYTDEKETYQFFINYDDVEEKVLMKNATELEIVKTPDGKLETIKGNEFVVPPLSMVAIKIK